MASCVNSLHILDPMECSSQFLCVSGSHSSGGAGRGGSELSNIKKRGAYKYRHNDLLAWTITSLITRVQPWRVFGEDPKFYRYRESRNIGGTSWAERCTSTRQRFANTYSINFNTYHPGTHHTTRTTLEHTLYRKYHPGTHIAYTARTTLEHI